MKLRWRVRALMMMTAVTAFLMAGARFWKESDLYASQARFHANAERKHRQEAAEKLESIGGRRNFFEKHRLVVYEESTAKIALQRAKLDAYRDNPAVTGALARRVERLREDLERRQTAWDDWLKAETREADAKVAVIQAEAEDLVSRAEVHATLKRRYERAALFPWESVGPIEE